MANITDVCNMALSFLGKNRITNIDEQTEPARQCKLMYGLTKEHLLRHYDWGFAKKVTLLAELETKHPRWEHVYAYPNKCVRIVKIYNDDGVSIDTKNDKEKYEMFMASDNQVALGCDVPVAIAEYIYSIDDINVVPSDFLEAFAHMLASNIAIPLTGSQELKNMEYQLATVSLQDARFHSAMERKREPDFPDSYVKARY